MPCWFWPRRPSCPPFPRSAGSCPPQRRPGGGSCLHRPGWHPPRAFRHPFSPHGTGTAHRYPCWTPSAPCTQYPPLCRRPAARQYALPLCGSGPPSPRSLKWRTGRPRCSIPCCSWPAACRWRCRSSRAQRAASCPSAAGSQPQRGSSRHHAPATHTAGRPARRSRRG